MRALTEAFWEAARALGRSPWLFHFEHPSLADRPLSGPLARERTAVPATTARVDAVNQLAAAARLAPALDGWRSTWVVAALAQYGYAAVRARRPYACWLAASLEDEWHGRRRGLPRSRRLALAANAPVLRRLERGVLRNARAVYAISPHSAGRLADAGGIPRDRVGVLPIPVDVERFTPGPPVAERLEQPAILFVGRASDPRKNVHALLDAFRDVRSRLPRARLRLVGDPPATFVGEGVDVLGRSPAVAEEMRRAALLVLPSLQEGFGIVVAEALACATPVVVTPCGGPEHLVSSSQGGVVLSSFRVDELADAVAGLLVDPARLEEMGSRGREHVAREHAPERLHALLADAFAELDASA